MGFSLQQFSALFKIRDAAGQPYVLIGGQAVNYWAERYLASEPQLAELKPFTSEDIDFKGSRADVQRIAQQLELPASYPTKVEMTALAGTIPFQIGDLKSNIEIVRRIPGVSGSVEALAVQAEWDRKTIRVIDPISLLACKLELAATVRKARWRTPENPGAVCPRVPLGVPPTGRKRADPGEALAGCRRSGVEIDLHRSRPETGV